MKYLTLVVIGMTFLVSTILPASVNAQTAEELQEQITKLQDTLQDLQIKMKSINKKSSDTPKIKVGPGLKIKSGKNEIKIGGRIHFDVGFHDADAPASCEMADLESGSCFTDGTNFRRLRIGVSGKYGGGYFYKAQVDWGASAKQASTMGDSDGNADITSVDEAYLGYKLSKNSTITIGKNKIPLSFAESTSSNGLPFMERSPAVDAMTDHTLGPKRMNIQYRKWDRKIGYLLEIAGHGSSDMAQTETADESWGTTARLAYAPINEKNHVLHLGGWYDHTTPDVRSGINGRGDTSMEWDYRIGLNISDEKPIDADIGSDLGLVTGMDHYGAELAYLNGPMWFQSEWIWGEMERATTGSVPTCSSVEANMGYAAAGYVIGGNRSYTIKKGGWKRPKVKQAVGQGGAGVHELGIRWTNASLNGLCENYAGQGAMLNYTLGWNWYLNNNTRIMLNYIHADLDQEAVDEVTSQSPGTTTAGITNNGATVRAVGARFQVNW